MTTYSKNPDLIDEIKKLRKQILDLQTNRVTPVVLGNSTTGKLSIDASGNLIFTDKNGTVHTVVSI